VFFASNPELSFTSGGIQTKQDKTGHTVCPGASSIFRDVRRLIKRIGQSGDVFVTNLIVVVVAGLYEPPVHHVKPAGCVDINRTALLSHLLFAAIPVP
jgi:hypothetical protein